MDESQHQDEQNDGNDDVDQPMPVPLPQHLQDEEVTDKGTAQQKYPHKWGFKWPFAKTFRTFPHFKRWRWPPVTSLDNLDFWRQSRRVSSQTISNIFLVIFTAGLIVTSYLQWDILKQTLEETRRIVEAAYMQAKAAQDANDLAREAQKRSDAIIADADRPWLGLNAVDVTGYALNQRVEAQLHIFNSGKPPAFNVVMHTNIYWIPQGAPWVPPSGHPVTDTQEIESKSVVFPNQTITQRVPLQDPLSDDLFKQLQSGAVSLLFAGTITYDDRFQRHHTTVLCRVFKPDLYVDVLFPCPTGNTAD